MKRIFLGLITTLTSAGLMLGMATAQSSGCSIVDSGPNSNNTCSINTNNDLKVTCTNNTDVVFVNGQNANSGSVTLTNNTNGGYAYSGNAVNTNETTGKLDVSCAAKPAVASVPTPVSAQTAVPAAQAPVAAPQQAKALPNTGNDSLIANSAIALGVLALVAVIARLGLVTYRHFSLK